MDLCVVLPPVYDVEFPVECGCHAVSGADSIAVVDADFPSGLGLMTVLVGYFRLGWLDSTLSGSSIAGRRGDYEAPANEATHNHFGKRSNAT